jgi:hypothetical protein
MQDDEEREADAEHDQGNEEVAVSEDGAGLLSKFHSGSVGLRGIDWRKHKDLAVGVSRSLPLPVQGSSNSSKGGIEGREQRQSLRRSWAPG